MGISSLHGAKWQNVNDDNRKVYLTNAYRVPMTRPRQPIVIHIPGVDFDDHSAGIVLRWAVQFGNRPYDHLAFAASSKGSLLCCS